MMFSHWIAHVPEILAVVTKHAVINRNISIGEKQRSTIPVHKRGQGNGTINIDNELWYIGYTVPYHLQPTTRNTYPWNYYMYIRMKKQEKKRKEKRERLRI